MRSAALLVLLAMAVMAAMATDDYYALLGVPRDASAADIRRAYRHLTLTKHPDKGGDPDEFARISHAYEVLSDRDKRANYDQFGEVLPLIFSRSLSRSTRAEKLTQTWRRRWLHHTLAHSLTRAHMRSIG